MKTAAGILFPMLQRSGILPCLIVLSGFLIAYPPASQAQRTRTASSDDPPCRDTLVYALKDTGDIVEGPVCVGVRFNALRYSGQLGRTVTVSAGSNLGEALTLAATAGITKSGGTTGIASLKPGQQDTLTAIQSDYQGVRDRFYKRDAANVKSEGTIAAAASALKNLVLASDDLFGSGGATAVVARVRDGQLQGLVKDALGQKWETSDDIYLDVHGLQGRLEDFVFANTNLDATSKEQIKTLQSNMTSLLTGIASSRTGGDRPTGVNKQISIITAWRALLESLDETSFVLKTYVGCGSLFNQNKQIAVRLLRTDRLPSFDGAPPSLIDLKDPFVTVTCASPFAVSVGTAFSFLSTNKFGVIPSGASGTNQFGVTDTASMSPLPIGVVHARIHEWFEHKLGVYGSFGVAAHILGDDAGGSAAEYLTGFSVALLRTVYITPGWHVGKVASLKGGYTVGQEVPSGITAAPVTSSYKSGFGFAVTFTKP